MGVDQENIDTLLSKYFSGEALPEEALYLQDWCNESQENRSYFDNSEKIFYPKKYTADIQKSWRNIKTKIDRPKRSFIIGRTAAVAFLLVGISVAIYFLMNRENNEVQYRASSESLHAVLSDGTAITLSPNSQLTLAAGYGNHSRNLNLKGSAYFSVIHNEVAEFVVDAGGVFIKDIGTKFFIHTSLDTDTVYVHVDEGIVLLFDSMHSSMEIHAGGSAVYVKSIGKIISNAPTINKPVEFSFSKLRLAEVVQKLANDYKVKIKITNPSLNDCLITTQFKGESIETILSVITETLNITYQKTDSGYIITGDRCDQ